MNKAANNKDESNFKAQSFVYHCDDNFTFVAHSETSNEVWLFFPDNTVKLLKEPSASGVKYSGVDSSNKTLIFWQKGQQALISIAQKTYRNCQNNLSAALWEHAKLMGADFRAIGQEPGWSLIISQENGIQYLGGYGQTKEVFTYVKPVENIEQASSTFYLKNDGHQLSIILSGSTCADSMSGEQYETRVEINFDGKVLKGCGKSLH